MPSTTQQANRFLVSVNGQRLDADVERRLVSAAVEDSLHLPDMFVLGFRDPHRDVVEKTGATMGASVTLSVATDDAPGGTPLIEGEITAFEAEFDPEGTLTILRGYDSSHRLTRGRRTKSYLNMSYS
jgi:hypothetical protein